MLDSPFDFCPHCRQYVLLDQTQRECAREHECRDRPACPLQCFFTGIEFRTTHNTKARKSKQKR